MEWHDNNGLLQEERTRRAETFETGFQPIRGVLTPRQWLAVCLFWRDFLAKEEIAIRLKVELPAVNALLRRAWMRKERRERRLRDERYELLKRFAPE